MSEHLYDPAEVARRQHLAECKECQQIAFRESCRQEGMFYLIVIGTMAVVMALVFRRQIMETIKDL